MRTCDDQDYLNSPEFRDALQQYEDMMAGGPSAFLDAEELTDIAEYYLIHLEDQERARECNEYALSLYPGATAPLIFQARQHLLDNDLDTCQQLCDAIPEQEDREVKFLNAEIMVRRKQQKQAFTYLLECSKGIEEDHDFFLFDAAYIFMDYNEYKMAYAMAEELLKIAPDWYRTWQIMADSLLGLAAFDQALEYINKMLDIDPFCTETWDWASEAYSGTGKYEQAIEAADYALAVNPEEARALQLKGHANLHLEAYEQALKLYGQVLDITPNDETTMAFIAYCHLCMGQLDKALQAIEEAEKLSGGKSPEQQMIYEQHANVMAALERYDEAIDFINKAEAIGGCTNNDYDAIRQDFMRRKDEE